MSRTMRTAEGGEEAPEAPMPTHINVHSHQEPVLNLSCLLWPSAPNTTSWTPGHRRLLVASSVVQIMLGLMSGVLGGLGCIAFSNNYPYSMERWVAGIWTGAVAVLAGVICFIYEKWGGTCWSLTIGLKAMLLSIWVLLLLTSLTPMFLYCWRRLQPKEKKDQKPLLGASII
uniref:Transmembrane protein 176A n=1 Tax=Pipistrellus kuhlii TaxID=59472 RepID=A0A7J7S6J3_PIPKU|nr:transmembrane protein 176A [Pipistrellus kuhlii]